MFTFRLTSVKKAKEHKPSKQITCLLYAQAIKREDGTWFARVKTKGFEGYKDIVIDGAKIVDIVKIAKHIILI